MKCRLVHFGLIVFILTFLPLSLLAQVPFIKSLSKTSGPAQGKLTIQGINFGTNASNIKVVFGGVASVPETISDQLIEVSVPYGAVYEDVDVINTSTGLMGYSSDPFLQSYGGTNPFNATQVSAEIDFNSESGLYDMATADFDGDGKMDVATANNNSTSISVFLNTGSPGSISFTKLLLSPGVNTLHAAYGDLNGDGKPEILVTEFNGSRVFVFKNNSTVGTLSFASPQTLTMPGSKVSQVVVRDMDFNGKPDLVVTDQGASRVFVVANQSTLATIQFGVPIGIALNGTSVTDGLVVGDLNGDARPEIAVSEFLSPTGKIFILQNLSIPGTLSFTPPTVLTTSTTISNLHIGDLDGDAKPELAASGLLTSSVLIFGNQCTASTIQFAAPVQMTASQKPWGIEFGDMDGDGKTDIAVASVTQKAIVVLSNQSTVGNFVFQTLTIPTTYINRHLKISDVDNDGRPDLNFTSVDDNNAGIMASKISVILNKNCVIPTLAPNGPLTICSSLSPHQLLTASANPGATYEWFLNSVSLGAPSATPTQDVNASGSGSYTVKLVNGSCSNSSAAVSVTVVSTAPLGAVTPTPVTPVCVGGTLTLAVNNVGASDYVWTGPDNFSAHGVSVTRTGFQDIDAGKYTVEVMVGSCVTQRATVVADVVDVPNAQAIFSGSDVICQGQTKQYSVFPAVTGYTYQWAEQTSGDIAGATGATYTATASGSYYVKLSSTANTTCAAIASTAKLVRIASIPFVNFSSPTSACVGQAVTFTDQSTVDSDTVGLHVRYAWNFGDGSTANIPSPSHTFATAQTYTVTLTVAYINQSCPASKAASLAVTAAPTLAITSPSNLFSFCSADSLMLQVLGSFDSYVWNTGNKTSSIYAKKAGTYSVVVTSGACTLNASQAVSQFSAPTVTATADPASIKVGASSKLSATGLVNYLWRPAKAHLSDSLSANVVASPIQNTTYTVSGKDANGCPGQATVVVVVLQDNALDSMHPTNFFSPNGDTINDFWQVENAPGFSQCGVTIYDERGFKVYQAKPYLNDWNGISSGGKVLPAGVYYYVMKCDDSGNNYLAGSINIVR